ncbi:hypothetical protein [Listeria rocourtiae]|uniref:hypothetical protein n=1 Tax=Listeria rocourtiae TaxID=647910 RepID=UPI0003E88ED4|nr:hypothetical protein [Listeria rocourtiae]EUJ48401.1 hypothetical protein PROCOU_05623 [Listeria rocourtiae FSL F6-920]
MKKKTLPAPHQVGGMKLEAMPNKADGNIISWQNDKTDYTVSNFKDPLDGVKITTSFTK